MNTSPITDASGRVIAPPQTRYDRDAEQQRERAQQALLTDADALVRLFTR